MKLDDAVFPLPRFSPGALSVAASGTEQQRCLHYHASCTTGTGGVSFEKVMSGSSDRAVGWTFVESSTNMKWNEDEKRKKKVRKFLTTTTANAGAPICSHLIYHSA